MNSSPFQTIYGFVKPFPFQFPNATHYSHPLAGSQLDRMPTVDSSIFAQTALSMLYIVDMDHLAGLNDAQREAVLTIEGPLMVLAGAGAGKTRVITHRMLEIVQRGAAPSEILAITFTNKAASEMRERAITLLAKARGGLGVDIPPTISTFHSLGLLIIKGHYRELGFKKLPVIFDRADSLRAVKEELKRLSIGEELEPRAVLGAISREKGKGITASAYAERADTPHERRIASVWFGYEKTLDKESGLDFDDLLLRAATLLGAREDIRDIYRRRWKFVHIDEFQDTNRIQADMARHLTGSAQNICVVGDIDQTIYTWRGAHIQNMLAFDKQYPGAKVILLEENYRSTKTIIAAANDIIAKNVFRREKHLFTNNRDGDTILLYQAFDETDEAQYVARTAAELISQGVSPRDIAVLYRANFQSRALEEAFLSRQIPYQVLGTKFFERREVKDVMSFIRAALHETSADIARAVAAVPRGIGKVTLAQMLAGQDGALRGAAREKAAAFYALLARIRAAAAEKTPSALVRMVAEDSGLTGILRADKIEGAERLENLRELGTLAARYDTLPPTEGVQAFLENAALASDQDEMKDESNAVRLMTVHASKGLEFPYVFVTGLEEGLFPYERQDEKAEDAEEERRLMYVAVTRAGTRLYLSYACYRTVFGAKNATIPSSFLSDISDGLVELAAPERLGRTIYLD